MQTTISLAIVCLRHGAEAATELYVLLDVSTLTRSFIGKKNGITSPENTEPAAIIGVPINFNHFFGLFAAGAVFFYQPDGRLAKGPRNPPGSFFGLFVFNV